MYNEAKEVCAYANSIWFYVDTKKGRPVKYEQKEGTGFEIDEAEGKRVTFGFELSYE